MNCYLVPIIGDGSDFDPYRPDVPDGTTWVAVTIEPPDPTCVIQTADDLAAWSPAVPIVCPQD